MLLTRAVVAGVLCCGIPQACLPKQKTDAEVNYAVGDWWKRADSNLLVAAMEKQQVIVCLTSEGRVDASVWPRNKVHFEKIVRSALSDWFAAIGAKVQINFVEPSCVNDLTQGRVQVVLHYDEPLFQSRISQTASPTLGVFLIGDGGLHLNVKGVLNPARDATLGYKTTLHELGHAMGLNHSQVTGAVMQPMLSRASARLTADDVAGIKEVWNRVSQQRSSAPRESGSSKGMDKPVRAATRAAEIQPSVASPAQGAGAPEAMPSSSTVRLALRYDSWFKLSTAQSYLLAESEKCPLKLDQRIVVQILDGGALSSGHLRVALAENLPGCAFGGVGTVGFLYQGHID
ncbi:MAG: matrixin family metalloprotease [Betaproteobacteria bacterium]|nr:matrixin family metalloprotease [Betaproteobacteria bacterium]